MRFLQYLSINASTLKRKFVSKFHPGVSFYSSLSQDLLVMLNDANNHDVIIRAGKNQDVKEFHAHSNILKARLPYLKKVFPVGWISKNSNNMIEFRKPNINPAVFEMILKYIYTDEVDLTNRSGADILGLLVASDELCLEKLSKHVEDHLIEKQTTWIEQNSILVLHSVFKLSSCKELRDHCLEFICENPLPFISSKEFPSLDKDILYSLLKRDDLNIEEAVVWDYLIKWGIEQTPGLGGLNNNRTIWNDNNFEALKKTLDQLIPLIRFSDINSKDFFNKVRPYKAIISNQIYEQIMEFYMTKSSLKFTTLPPRIFGKIQIDSKIIKPKFISTIVNWIEKKDANAIRNKNDSSYKFNLIYRGGQDGSWNSFVSNCNLKGEPTLVLVKCQNSQKVFGGYTPIGLYGYGNGYNYPTPADSFIFSFENNDIQNAKLSYINNYNNNYYYDYISDHISDCGYVSNFGDALLKMQNLHVKDRRNSYHYKNSIIKNDFYTIEEFEAYRVVKSPSVYPNPRMADTMFDPDVDIPAL